ncbi:hypothetical protein I308_104625 [Cryptococcus tetragattii IND107]|uniref:Mediator of RNA polymerase II transcription subunit 10 n=1 Tax=Cryptococcus tetragattii IND107 TaxID=1296105 RepID=A0ABR3BN53_9TREE|nr:hypothetical protein I308_01215 [Cryptococcus tetragattii IND107]
MSLDHHHLPSPAPTPAAAPPNPAAGPAVAGAPPDQVAIRTAVENQLLQLSQDLYEMEISAGHVKENRETAVADYLENINKAFINLSNLASQMTDSVPHQIIENVDRYKNPHVYTRQTITRATGENQYALGRVLGLESFRCQLNDAISSNFPEIPLPERRHQPVKSSHEEDVPQEGRSTMANGYSVKIEDDAGPHDQYGQSIVNGMSS